MSFYFNVKTEKRVSHKEVLSNLKFESVEIIPSGDLDDHIDSDGCKVFIPFKSSRGVILYYSEHEYSIVINVIASEVDFKLALNVTEIISRLTNSLVEPEDRETPIDIESLKNDYNKDWIDRMKLSGISFFSGKIGDEGLTVSIGCCYMNYSIGPNIHSQLDKSSEEAYYNGLIEHICKTQFFDRQKYVIPGIMQVTDPKNNVTKRIITLYREGAQFLPSADILIMSNGEDRIEIPYAKIRDFECEKFSLVDEEHYLVETLSEGDFNELFKKAGLIIAKPSILSNDKSSSKTVKKWWKLW